MNHPLLKGLTIALNTHLTVMRRHLDRWSAEKLREELALVAAAVDQARPEIGRELIADRAEAAAALLSQHDQTEIEPLAGYALWSEHYHDQADNPLTALEYEVFDRLVGEAAGLRVLDVGCGTGRQALRLAARGAQVTGVDPCPEMLAAARAQAALQGRAVDWLAGGYQDLAPEPVFDLVISNLVLCHIEDLPGAIAAMARCLQPGGRLVITDLHYLCLLIGWRTSFSHGGRRYVITNYVHSVGSYLAALRAAGLELETVEDIPIDERLRDVGMGSIVDKWEGFPFGIAFAARKPA